MGASISDFSFLPLGAAVASGTCDTRTAGCHSQKLRTRRHLSGVCLFLPPVLSISFVCSGIWGTCTETGASSPSSVPQSVGRGQASQPHCPDSKMGRNLVSRLRSRVQLGSIWGATGTADNSGTRMPVDPLGLPSASLEAGATNFYPELPTGWVRVQLRSSDFSFAVLLEEVISS